MDWMCFVGGYTSKQGKSREIKGNQGESMEIKMEPMESRENQVTQGKGNPR